MKRASFAAALALSLLSLPLARAPRPLEAGTVVRLELEQLARSAELVLEGRVLSTRAHRDERGQVRTEFTLSVHRTFAGAPLGTRTFELPGGMLPDGSGTLVPGMPTVVLGEDVLLFLTGESGQGLRVPVGLAQGKLSLVRDEQGRAALARDSADLVLLDPLTGASAAATAPSWLAYEAVAARIVEALRDAPEAR